MKRARFPEEQIIGILKAAEAAGNIREVCREHNITEQTFYRWRRQHEPPGPPANGGVGPGRPKDDESSESASR